MKKFKFLVIFIVCFLAVFVLSIVFSSFLIGIPLLLSSPAIASGLIRMIQTHEIREHLPSLIPIYGYKYIGKNFREGIDDEIPRLIWVPTISLLAIFSVLWLYGSTLTPSKRNTSFECDEACQIQGSVNKLHKKINNGEYSYDSKGRIVIDE